MTTPIPIDVLVVGGGAAGLWLLDELVRAGRDTLLLDKHGLGAGQTVASQGIIHGGVKYSLLGAVTGSAKAISAMPGLWRACYAGKRQPDLSAAPLRAEHCHIWHTTTLKSRLGFGAAGKALRVTPQPIDDAQRPAALRGCPGSVLRLDEQVIDTAAFVAALAAPHRERLLSIAEPIQVRWATRSPGQGVTVTLDDAQRGMSVGLAPRYVVLTAGAGNAALREALGLDGQSMQRRPLHMVMVRGGTEALPPLHGHCIDGQKTRVTITSAIDAQGRVVWQVGGQVSEDGMTMEPGALIAHAKQELAASLPGIDWSGRQWATYRVDRAEGRTGAGLRPENVVVQAEGHVVTAWPTKLALAPELARVVMDKLGGANAAESSRPQDRAALAAWPRPQVALPPWETATWTDDR